jgi:hypothetical protein
LIGRRTAGGNTRVGSTRVGPDLAVSYASLASSTIQAGAIESSITLRADR